MPFSSLFVCMHACVHDGLLSENIISECLNLMILIRILMNINESHDSTPAEVERSACM